MTSPLRFIRGHGFVPFAALLLAAGCGQQTSTDSPPTTAKESGATATVTQASSTPDICAYRPDYNAIPTTCSSTREPADLYQGVLNLIRANCITLAENPGNPTEAEKKRAWEACMKYPPVLWVKAATSPDQFDAWNAQVERVAVFYRTSNAPDVTATSFEQSLRKIREVANEMVNSYHAPIRQVENSNRRILDSTLPELLKAKAEAEGKPVQAELAHQRETMSEIRSVFDRHQAKLQTYQPAYAALVAQFETYRTNEPILLDRLQVLVQQASTATLATLPNVQLELVQLSRAESIAPQTLQLEAFRLSRQLSRVHDEYEEELEPHFDFIRTHNVARPKLADEPMQVLANIQAYADSRYVRTTDIVTKTLDGIRRRQTALMTLQADQATRQTIVQNTNLAASTQFLAETTARVTEVGKLPPRSTKLRLYFLAGKLQEHESILQLESVCAKAAATPWMGTGCNTLALQFSKSRNYVNLTLPGTMRLNIASMRTAGVNATLLQEIEQHLAAGRVRAAAISHDVALRSSEDL
ncbi:hypothetical protein MYSTI_01031 [Myxococcus stipitatus DSM 14675]|uniref:Lipoprotein n=1 Tax=Myxococcus stipitatus (strain DSM 14675 / JCM 12634 / Mx s8) TaxID=1278073 RepID=L7U3G2_MYXSD|nr:hypothetical protein [Myxococcus stipitatus]AGC42380.1 hypothetical protein MYSTI_01031 [Myxococcus stipitatus DSM 14675]